MGRLVDIAKAARILGVPRLKIQKTIRSGHLQTFEGKVDLDHLQQIFPAMALHPQSLIEKTQIIRDVAYSRRIENLVLSSHEELEGQLRRLKVELSVAKAQAFGNRKILEDLVGLISDLQQNSTMEQKDTLGEISIWLASRINNPIKAHR